MASALDRLTEGGTKVAQSDLDSHLRRDIEMDSAVKVVLTEEIRHGAISLRVPRAHSKSVSFKLGRWTLFGYHIGRVLLDRAVTHLKYSAKKKQAKANAERLRAAMRFHDFDTLMNSMGPVAQRIVGSYAAYCCDRTDFLKEESNDIATALVLSCIGSGLSLSLAEEEIFGER